MRQTLEITEAERDNTLREESTAKPRKQGERLSLLDADDTDGMQALRASQLEREQLKHRQNRLHRDRKQAASDAIPAAIEELDALLDAEADAKAAAVALLNKGMA